MPIYLHPDIPAREQERGAILVVVLVLIFAVTLVLLAYLYLNNNNSLIASNLAVQSAAQEATDYGLNAATAALLSNSKPTLTVMPTTGYLSSGVDVSTAPLQPPSDPNFWADCVDNNQCVSLPVVRYGPYNFDVEYVIFAPIASPQPVPGYEEKQTGSPSFVFYPVFIHSARTSGGGLSVTVQSVIKVMQ